MNPVALYLGFTEVHMWLKYCPLILQSQLKLHFKWTSGKLEYNHHSNNNLLTKSQKNEIWSKIIKRRIILGKCNSYDQLVRERSVVQFRF